MHFVYAGLDELLNRRSLDTFDQVFIVKLGYCQELDTWEDRFNDGFKNRKTGIKESLPLALCTGWRRIATVEVGEWTRASPGIEGALLKWADARFGSVRLMPVLNAEVEAAHTEWKPGCAVKKNGLGELRHVPIEAVGGLVDSIRQSGINDPLAEDVVSQLSRFLEAELQEFSRALGLSRRGTRHQ